MRGPVFGTFVVGLGVRGLVGDPNWLFSSLISGVIAVIVALGAPRVETWLIWRKRHAIRLEEVRAEAEELRQTLKDDATKASPPADVDGLRKRLGNLRLRYIDLERAFIAQGGAQELWHNQTTLHNEALKIIDVELGRDYWAQFKDVKAAPIMVPASFPSQDAERLNLLT